jgi:3-deoxy-manno-octulosonate cytidylyltransferase (CMP-KDO synthetase)
VIPARYGSSRFPGKPLASIAGLPMIEHVRRRSLRASCAARVVVATDDERIASVVRSFGGEVVLTPDVPSGTHRCAAALEVLGGEPPILVNVQGDQPLVEPAMIDLVAACVAEGAQIGTLVAPFPGDTADPHKVKAVLGAGDRALWFSRAAIPHRGPWWLHVGIYGFTPVSLRAAIAAPRGPSCISEDLEQLAWLESGLEMRVARVASAPAGVDTPEHLLAIASLLASQRASDRGADRN